MTSFRPKKSVDAIYISYGNKRRFWVEADKDHPNALTAALAAAEEAFWKAYDASRVKADTVMEMKPKGRVRQKNSTPHSAIPYS